jgi:3-phenylpropionate/cinnamic acid dioxygenase small subunit
MVKLSADDRLDILELLGHYCRCIDTGRWDELPGLFAPDAVVDGGPIGQYQGADGIARMIATLKGLPLMMRHYVTNVRIEATADGARTHAYVLAQVGPKPGQLNATTGFYEDELVKRDGGWRIRKRAILLDMA